MILIFRMECRGSSRVVISRLWAGKGRRAVCDRLGKQDSTDVDIITNGYDDGDLSQKKDRLLRRQLREE